MSAIPQIPSLRRNLVIGVAGNIGVGKTTLCKALADEYDAAVFYERAEHNPYLADFYADPLRHALAAQVRFVSDRVETAKEAEMSLSSIVVLDRVLYEDRLFASNGHELGLIDERDWETYSKFYDLFAEYVRPPDVIVYLRASVDTLMKRIAKRGRECERAIERSYLEALQAKYETWLLNERHSPVLLFDWENPNRVSDVMAEVFTLFRC
jgi:deoxyadenosine/deoxycytidine kinase